MASTLDYLLASKYKVAKEEQQKAVEEAARKQAKKKSKFGGFMGALSPFAGMAATAGLNMLLPGAGFLATGLMGGIGSYLGSQATEQVAKGLGYGPMTEAELAAEMKGAKGQEGDIGYHGFDPSEYAEEIGGAKDFYSD